MPLDEKKLNKGQQRKLQALRNSVGHDIGTQAFISWLESEKEPEDKTAAWIVKALQPLVGNKKLTMPKAGYHVARGRGRIIVTPFED